MDQESLKSILILGRLPLRMLGIEHVHRFLIGPRFRIQKGLVEFSCFYKVNLSPTERVNADHLYFIERQNAFHGN